MQNIRILCLSGSLRIASYNTAALHAIKLLATKHIEIVIFEQMGELPLFNPDIENNNITPVAALRTEIQSADGLIIASPEYAHGISGVLKNALDWLVGGDEFPFMPLALINTSPRAHHALDALHEVLTTMSGNIIRNACTSIPLLGSNLNANSIARHTEISKSLLNQLDTFYKSIITT